MTTAETVLVAALLAQVAWTFLVMLRAGRARVVALLSGRVSPQDVVLSGSAWPDDVRRASNNMNNQFETPTIFYALVLAALVLKLVSLAFAVIAWGYVASRIVHSAIHIGPNDLRRRSVAFFAGFACLVALWGLLVAAVLFGRGG